MSDRDSLLEARDSMWNLRSLAECVLAAPQDHGINVGLARDLAREALRAADALPRAAHLVENLVQQVPEFTGVIGPAGEREDDYIRDQLAEEAHQWRQIAGRQPRRPL